MGVEDSLARQFYAERCAVGHWDTRTLDDKIDRVFNLLYPFLNEFSTTNIKNMTIFYEQWSPYLNRQTLSDDLISS